LKVREEDNPMTVFKRPKDSMDDYRRAQEALRRPAAGTEEPEDEAATPSEQAWRRVAPASAVAASPAPMTTAAMEGAATTASGTTVIARDSNFNGKLKSEGNVRVEGVFDGELEATKSIYVAESARANARLKAAEVVIAGAFDGQVDADSRVHLAPTARAKGRIKTAVLVIEEGAVVDCHFTMKPGKGEK
jgi:cytoskeletal protein CcmA (bactofilin family)